MINKKVKKWKLHFFFLLPLSCTFQIRILQQLIPMEQCPHQVQQPSVQGHTQRSDQEGCNEFEVQRKGSNLWIVQWCLLVKQPRQEHQRYQHRVPCQLSPRHQVPSSLPQQVFDIPKHGHRADQCSRLRVSSSSHQCSQPMPSLNFQRGAHWHSWLFLLCASWIDQWEYIWWPTLWNFSFLRCILPKIFHYLPQCRYWPCLFFWFKLLMKKRIRKRKEKINFQNEKDKRSKGK